MTFASDTYFKKGVNIHVFIGHMQRNFILTDVMKTGDHSSYEQFIAAHSLHDQTFEYTGEYYTLHNYDLDSYDRKFALIDYRIHNNRLVESNAYQSDLQTRLEILHQQGFKFIIANPWESMDNIKNQVFLTGEKLKDLNVPYPYHTWTGGVSWFWSYMYHKHKDNKLNVTHDHNGSYWHKKHEFLYLNKFPRKHRVKLFQSLKNQKLIDNSITTFLGLQPPITMPADYELPWVNDRNFDNHPRWGNYPRWGMDQDIYELPYTDTVCSIVSETNDNDYEVFMTEKIWKPIMAQHVFVVHGNYLYLQKLREMGFKTFGSCFDESYDLEQDPDKRINKIVSLCRELKDPSTELKHGHKKWQDIYLQTKALRQHNYDTFFDKEKLRLEINKTLNLFLEFADSR